MSSYMESQMSSASTSSKGKNPSKFGAQSQARFGYLGHLSLRSAHGQPDALRNVSALDGASFLPSVMVMQRAPTPWQYNTPSRMLEEPLKFGEEDERQKDSGASCDIKGNGAKAGELTVSQPLPANYVRRIRRRAQKAVHGIEVGNYKRELQDLKLLADSASRSGNVYQALQAYHKMGVILDNNGKHREAIQKYKQFLSLSIASKNAQGEALAYNCLGINYFKIGQYDDAIQYHNQHLELADGTGRLIAHTNLGLTFQAMGLSEHAAIHHQHAIEYANRMGAKDAQCFAVGNLGIASAAQGDLATSRVCLQYHLSATQREQSRQDGAKITSDLLKQVNKDAHHRLGQVNAIDGQWDEAAVHFAHALDVAKSKGDQDSEEKSSALLGVAEGLRNFELHREQLLMMGDERPQDASSHFGN